MDNNDNDLNAGNTGSDSFDNSDLGDQGGNADSSSDNPGGQNGQQTNTGDAQINNLKQQIKSLNKALIEARRGKGNQPQGDDQFDPNNPQAQYGVALQIATGNLREGIENIFSLYPEVDASVIGQIRKNPWAFASQQSYINGDFESAQLEIEEYLLELAEAKAENNPTPSPATINPNTNQGNQNQVSNDPEAQDPMTMPMADLERMVAKGRTKLGTK